MRAAIAVAREWAGDGLVALLLSGSHATGEATWLASRGRSVSLSDVDLFAAMRDADACREAEARARLGRAAAAVQLREAGLEAPVEVGFLTLEGLARMPARPGTIELARHGVAVAGDASALGHVPAWKPGEVPAEEALLLLENRGFELLLAWPRLGAAEPLERARARHSTLKAAADLATVMALRAGELPDGTASRVEWARARAAATLAPHLPPDRIAAAAELDGLWAAALAWRGGAASPPSAEAASDEWRRAVRAWCAIWWWCFPAPGADPWARALRSAARASLPRRLRRCLGTPRAGSPARWLRLALAGTPHHRVNASAAVLLLAAAAGGATPSLPAGALRALHSLGVGDTATWAGARREVVRAWDEGVMRGQRGTGSE